MTVVPSPPSEAGDAPPGGDAAVRAEAFVDALVAYTADVRLDADGLETVLAHMASLEALDSGDDDGLEERTWHDGRFDLAAVVADEEYVGWCRSHGLDPDGFFRDLMRLEALTMRENAERGLAVARAQLPEQRRQIEAMRQAMGEEAFAQSVAAMEQAEAMLERSAATIGKLPRPTQAEQALLDANRERIQAAFGDREDDEISGMEAGSGS